MRIVTDGEFYAVERGWWIFKEYLSLETGNWYYFSYYQPWCWGTLETVKVHYRMLQIKKKIQAIPKDQY